MILPIITYPNKILRTKAEAVVFPLDKKIQKLTQDMVETLIHDKGLGLAAPQVDHSVRLVIIHLEQLGLPPFPLYNPKIVSKSFKKDVIEEGCLSLPGIFGMVKRPKKVTLEAQNVEGKKIKITDDGWLARVVQHEIDHLNGILIIDTIKKYTQGEVAAKELKKI